MTVADPKQITAKDKPITHTWVFVEFYNYKNYGQVYEIYRMIKLKKMCILTAYNPFNGGAHQIIKIFWVLASAHMVFRN